MSKAQTIQTIRGEVKRLNTMIDIKIIQGLSYRRESLRHKSLMSQLARLTSQADLQGYEVKSQIKQEIQSFQTRRPRQMASRLKWYQRPMNINFANLASAFLF